jgi:hypothetical protein
MPCEKADGACSRPRLYGVLITASLIATQTSCKYFREKQELTEQNKSLTVEIEALTVAEKTRVDKRSEELNLISKMADAAKKLSEESNSRQIKMLTKNTEKSAIEYRADLLKSVPTGAIAGGMGGALLGRALTGGQRTSGVVLGGLLGSAMHGPTANEIATMPANSVRKINEIIEHSDDLAKVIKTKWQPNTPIFACYADYEQCNALGMAWTRCAPALWICAMETLVPGLKK